MEEAPSRGGASDIFDSVLNLESTFIQKGRAEANSDKKSVDLDAYDTGKRYGEEIGYELGFISGVVSVLEERAMVEALQADHEGGVATPLCNIGIAHHGIPTVVWH